MAFCCCSSATGAKVIAILSLIGSILSLIVYGSLVVFIAVRQPERWNHTEEAAYAVTGIFGSLFNDSGLGFFFEQDDNQTLVMDGETYYRSNYVDFLQNASAYLSLHYIVLCFIISVYGTVLSIELLQGVRQKNYWRCNFWLRWYAVALIASIGCQLVLTIFVYENIVYKLINLAFGFLIGLYFYFVVYQYSKELKMEMEERNQYGGKK